MLKKTHEGGPANIDFFRGAWEFELGLPSMSKFLHYDLGGMIKISIRDTNMIEKRSFDH